MSGFWAVLELEPTRDVSAIKRAYAEKAKTCHPEEDPEGFLNLRKAYEAALDYAENDSAQPPAGSPELSAGKDVREKRPTGGNSTEEEVPVVPAGPEGDGWQLRDQEPESATDPYADSEAIRNFLDLYAGKQRKDTKRWMDYFTSNAFLAAGWNSRFTALLLEKVTEVEQDLPPYKEFLMWLCTAYQFSVKEDVELDEETLRVVKRERRVELCPGADFDGMESILRIAAKGPLPKRPGGDELALLESFKDYRHLVRLAEGGAWGDRAVEEYLSTLNHYISFYIKDRCDPKANMDNQRHPAGLRLILYFLRREDLPETLYREAWRKLDLKSAVMGRAKVLYSPLRELVLERVPNIVEEKPENFLRLNQEHEAYLVRVKAEPEREEEESAALFQREDLQRALRSPRFVSEQLLTYSSWRREGMGAGLLRRVLEFYRENPGIPRAGEVIKELETDLRERMADNRNREDAQAEARDVSLTLEYRPLVRHWLNTAFFTARDPETGMMLVEYLSKYFPYQADWSRRFAEGDPRTIALCGGEVEAGFYPRHIEYRVNGGPVYRPCLPFERVVKESGDDFLFLLPLVYAPESSFSDVFQELLPRLSAAVPEEDRALIARCLAGAVCCLPADEYTGEPVPPEVVLPLTLFAETEEQLFGCGWLEGEGELALFEQTVSGRRIRKQYGVEPDRAETEARRLLAEAVSPTNYDFSLLKELPLKVYVLPPEGPEYVLKQEGVREVQAELDVHDYEVDRGELVTEEALARLLGQFAKKALRRLELSWFEGSLVFVQDPAGYACFYFERGGDFDFWYAMLSKPEVYMTVDVKDVVRVPFGLGKLEDYCLHKSPASIMRNLERVFPEMGKDRINSGGVWLWASHVNRSNGQHKLYMAQQKLGGFPPHRGRNHPTKTGFVFSRYPVELVRETPGDERERVELRSGSYGRASAALLEFMNGKLARLRLTWASKSPEQGQKHLVLVQDSGRFLLAWLEESRERAFFCVPERAEKKTFLERLRGFCYWLLNLIGLRKKDSLISEEPLHPDVKRIRNCVDLLLDDIDYTDPVVERYFSPAKRPYGEIRMLLMRE